MTRDFNTTNKTRSTIERAAYRGRFNSRAYFDKPATNDPSIKKVNFYERVNYGAIDNLNNSVIPNEEYIVNTQTGRVLDFVADSYSLMRLNFGTALRKGLVSNQGSLFGNLEMVSSYSNPKVRYGRYLDDIFQFYNKTHIPNILGTTSIASYEDYVKHFFKFFLNDGKNYPLTMTRWNTSYNSNVLDSGLAFAYAEVPYDADQIKIDRIIDHPCFLYVKNLAMNMSFSVVHDNPNILLYDLASPAGDSIRYSYGLFSLTDIFNNRFIKTCNVDNDILYNNININYNKYVFENPRIKIVSTTNCKTTTEYIDLQPSTFDRRPYDDLQELDLYIKIRQKEEGDIFHPQKLDHIYKKSKYFLKKVDKPSAIGYINNVFRDQVWNKNYGFHDAVQKFKRQTQTEAQRQQTGGGPTSGGSSY